MANNSAVLFDTELFNVCGKVLLRVDDFQPVLQMQVAGKIKTVDGVVSPIELFNTVDKVPEDYDLS